MNEDEKKLLDNLLDALQKTFGDSEKLKAYRKKLEDGAADMNTARSFSRELGQLAAEVFGDHAGEIVETADGYPAIMEALKEVYQPVTEYAAKTQQIINEQSGIGIKGKEAEFNRSRASGIAHNAAHAETVEAAQRAVLGPVRTFTESAVNDTIEENARFMQDSGLKTTVTRNSGGKCCDWCAKLDGTWEYGKQPKDFFRQHENCTCSITFRSEKSKRSWNGQKGRKQIELLQKEDTKEKVNNLAVLSKEEKDRLKKDALKRSIQGEKKDTIQEAKVYLEKELGIKVSYDYAKVNIDVANAVNTEIKKIYDKFGNLNEKGVLDELFVGRFSNRKTVAAYSPNAKMIILSKDSLKSKNSLSRMQEEALAEFEIGWWSSGDRMHSIRHELGHAIQRTLTDEKINEIEKIRQTIIQSIGGDLDIEKIKIGNKEELKRLQNAGEIISGYALDDTGEFIAESIAEGMTENPRKIAQMVVQIIER